MTGNLDLFVALPISRELKRFSFHENVKEERCTRCKDIHEQAILPRGEFWIGFHAPIIRALRQTDVSKLNTMLAFHLPHPRNWTAGSTLKNMEY